MGTFSHASDTISQPDQGLCCGIFVCWDGGCPQPVLQLCVVSSRAFSCSVNRVTLQSGFLTPLSPVVQPICPSPLGPWTGTS